MSNYKVIKNNDYDKTTYPNMIKPNFVTDFGVLDKMSDLPIITLGIHNLLGAGNKITYTGTISISQQRLYTIGSDIYGELGITPNVQMLLCGGYLVPDIENIKDIVYSGDNSIFFLLNDNTVKCCGKNTYAKLGLGHNNEQYSLIPIPNLTNVKQIACGINHTLFLLNDGTIKGCGYNLYGQLGLNYPPQQNTLITLSNITNVKKIVCGWDNTYFILNDNTVTVCGQNKNGELGLGNTIIQRDPIAIPNLSDVKDIICGRYYTVFLLNNNTIKVCGNNNNGQLGLNDTTNKNVPTLVSNLTNVKQVTCGEKHTVFLLNDGTVYGCGYNGYGQLGLNDTTNRLIPILIPNLSNVKQIACYANSTLFLMDNQKVQGCGYNYNGELWNGRSNKPNVELYKNNIIESHAIIKNVKNIFCGMKSSMLSIVNEYDYNFSKDFFTSDDLFDIISSIDNFGGLLFNVDININIKFDDGTEYNTKVKFKEK